MPQAATARARLARRAGVTLLELLIILAAVVVLVFIAMPTLKPTETETTIELVKDQLLYLHAREQEYFNRHGSYATFTELAEEPELGKNFDRRFANESPLIEGISFRGPAGSGPIYDIIATLPDGSRYKVDQTGKITPLQ